MFFCLADIIGPKWWNTAAYAVHFISIYPPQKLTGCTPLGWLVGWKCPGVKAMHCQTNLSLFVLWQVQACGNVIPAVVIAGIFNGCQHTGVPATSTDVIKMQSSPARLGNVVCMCECEGVCVCVYVLSSTICCAWSRTYKQVRLCTSCTTMTHSSWCVTTITLSKDWGMTGWLDCAQPKLPSIL